MPPTIPQSYQSILDWCQIQYLSIPELSDEVAIMARAMGEFEIDSGTKTTTAIYRTAAKRMRLDLHVNSLAVSLIIFGEAISAGVMETPASTTRRPLYWECLKILQPEDVEIKRDVFGHALDHFWMRPYPRRPKTFWGRIWAWVRKVLIWAFVRNPWARLVQTEELREITEPWKVSMIQRKAGPYDSRGTDAMSLRENAEEITGKLTDELNQRVLAAGVQVIETRLTRLSYAAEIAQAMLRQQQASAVVGARSKIVEGAVGMVKMALERLDEENVVELDEERKAAMVSNLLVVLCSEQATQQVVNTGSLYS